MGIRKPPNLALQSDRVLALLAARPLSAIVGQTNDLRDDNDDSSAPLRLRWIAY